MNESISHRRLLLWTLVGVAIVAVIAFIQPSTHEKADIASSIENPLAEALLQVPDSIPSRQFKTQRWQSSLDVPVYFIHTPELDALDVLLTLDAGSVRDGKHPGLASLTAILLKQGSLHKTADDIALSLEQPGSEYYAFSDRDRSMLYLRTLADKEHLSPSIHLLSEIISQPAFRKDDLNRIKNQQLQTIHSLEKDPEYQSELYLMKSLYPNHPYASPTLGTDQSINSITEKDVQDFHRSFYVTRNLSIVMIGNITREQAEQISEQISLSLPLGAAAPALSSPENRSTSTSRHIPLETEQVHINLGFQGIHRASPDHPALYVASHIFGGSGLTSILMKELREQQGLVYGAYSSLHTGQYGGSFIISAETRAEEANRTTSEIKRLLHDFVSLGPTEQQLLDAKKMIAGSFPQTTASNVALTYQFGDIAFYNLPNDELERFLAAIQQLTTDDIKTALAKIIVPDQMVMVTAGPESDNKKKH